MTDVNEMAPCLVCGEPKPADEACWCLAPTAYVTLTFEVKARQASDLPSLWELATGIEDGLPKEFLAPGDEEGEWFIASIDNQRGLYEVYNARREDL